MRTLLPKDQETIVALSTPRGSGAIGVIRLSGNNAVKITDAIAKLSSLQHLTDQPTHTIHHGFVVNANGERLDEVLFSLMKAPKTFTGQDTVEISCHNNQFIIDNILQAAIVAGARHAGPGEFTMRGFLHGKFDLVQAEAINEIIHAPAEKILQGALAQLKGSLSERFVTVEGLIVELLTLCEASFEFLEEEQRDLDFAAITQGKITAILGIIEETKKHFSIQQHLKNGIRIALIGSVNAGKSSLFNALLGNDRAIVTEVAGTTRDSIEANLYKDGYFWLLVDTAGLRKTGDFIEQQGIERSYAQALQADVVLLVIDGSRAPTLEEQAMYTTMVDQYGSKTIVILNKNDLALNNTVAALVEHLMPLTVSTTTHTGIHTLETAIKQKIEQLFSLQQTTFVLSQRQFNCLREIEQKLLYIASSLADQVQYELVAYELKDLLEKVCELTGKHISEEVLDTVFSKFCVGK